MKLTFNEIKKKNVVNNDNVIVNDLTVESSHSYCVGYNNIIVHNCLTTKQSGIGYPMASLIYETRQIRNQMEVGGHENLPKIVADGGMKDYSDIIKALALGADYVMVGSIFNKCLESCADSYLYGIKLNKKQAKYFFKKKYPVKKYFRGMSTKEAQKAMGKTKFKTSEGVVRFRKVEYNLNGWVENFQHYLRNAMSYSNAKTLDEFIGHGTPIQITRSAYDRFNK
jgi:NAD(P)H-dependent flavin oxidoreductase YrpB (nitropropane dioxygenase family)